MEASQERVENEWIRRAAAGEADAFGRLVAAHQKALYAFVLGMVRRPDVADDLTQEAFIKAWRALPGFQGRSAFRTWLFQIALNRVRSWGRRPKWLSFLSGAAEEGEMNFMEERPDPRAEADPGAAAAREEDRRQVMDALARLPPREREVFTLKHVEDMKVSDVAAVTGLAEGTVKAHLFHAAEKMRRFLEEARHG